MKRIFKLLTNRLFIIGVMILLQIAWIVVFLADFSVRYNFVSAIINVVAVILAFFVITRWSNPSVKLSWVFFIMMVPIVGVPVYLIFGRPGLTRGTRKRMDARNAVIEPFLKEHTGVTDELRKEHPQAALQSDYIWYASHDPICDHTISRYYKCGEELFEAMLADIRKAEKFIFLEYFILDTGEMYDTLVAELAKKAAEGVDVRLIYDDVGCVNKMPAHFYRNLQQKGIKCAAFNPARPVLAIIMNHRDHRKIMVIDGMVSYTGGVNIADEYINKIDRFGYWKDTGVRLEGEATRNFTVMFLEMWDYIVDGSSDCTAYLPDPALIEQIPTQGYVQPYGDTPLDSENVGENVYLNMITRATKYVYIYTPYLILDQEMTVALCNAAKSGVDVRIVTPGIPDKRMVFLLTRSHYMRLLESGVRIYEYTPGFLHAKCFVCDDEYATVGSINLDYRSLYLHFECGVFFYQTPVVAQVYEDMQETFAVSREVFVEDCQRKHPFGMQMLHAFLRLIAPLL
ncbi:MAG: cardiolipin synthase [bacterium]|nr:cardiolipin synthase [bacterium]MDY4100645.1 cardiolipin synthase [Lachnospiraceae bacterium]